MTLNFSLYLIGARIFLISPVGVRHPIDRNNWRCLYIFTYPYSKGEWKRHSSERMKYSWIDILAPFSVLKFADLKELCRLIVEIPLLEASTAMPPSKTWSEENLGPSSVITEPAGGFSTTFRSMVVVY